MIIMCATYLDKVFHLHPFFCWFLVGRVSLKLRAEVTNFVPVQLSVKGQLSRGSRRAGGNSQVRVTRFRL